MHWLGTLRKTSEMTQMRGQLQNVLNGTERKSRFQTSWKKLWTALAPWHRQELTLAGFM